MASATGTGRTARGRPPTVTGFGLRPPRSHPSRNNASRTACRARGRFGGRGTPAHWLLLREHGSLPSRAGGPTCHKRRGRLRTEAPRQRVTLDVLRSARRWRCRPSPRARQRSGGFVPAGTQAPDSPTSSVREDPPALETGRRKVRRAAGKAHDPQLEGVHRGPHIASASRGTGCRTLKASLAHRTGPVGHRRVR